MKKEIEEMLSAPPEDFLEEWREPLREALATKDVVKIREALLPTLQANAITLAMNGASEAVRLDATKFILGQAGEGVQQKVKMSGFVLSLTNPALTGFGKPAQLGEFVSEVKAMPRVVDEDVIECEAVELKIGE